MFPVKRLLLAFGLCLMPFAAVAQSVGGGPGIPPIASAAAESNHVVKSACDPVAGCRLKGFEVVTGASAGFVLIFDATVAPADGAVLPVKCYSVAATSTFDKSWPDNPVKFSTGIVLVFSTTGCFTKTASATAFFSAEAL